MGKLTLVGYGNDYHCCFFNGTLPYSVDKKWCNSKRGQGELNPHIGIMVKNLKTYLNCL
jgi:hypothetical protein